MHLFVVFLAACFAASVSSVSLNEFVTLKYEERVRLDLLKKVLGDKLPHEHMKKDVYLIRWLREFNLDVPLTAKRLLDNLRWREENKMDTILKEDWTVYDSEYPFFVEGCDKEGKVVVSMFAGDYDLRRAVVAGNQKRFTRYIDKIFEECLSMVTKMIESGQNSTQAWVLVDLANFNLATQACPRCLPIVFHFLTTLQMHFPGYIHKIVIINTPDAAVPIIEIFKPALSKSIRSILFVYGKNSDKWKNILLKEIDSDQLSRKFGGSKKEALDFTEFRKTGQIYKCSNTNQI